MLLLCCWLLPVDCCLFLLLLAGSLSTTARIFKDIRTLSHTRKRLFGVTKRPHASKLVWMCVCLCVCPHANVNKLKVLAMRLWTISLHSRSVWALTHTYIYVHPEMLLHMYVCACAAFFVLVGKCLNTAWNTNKQQCFLSFVSDHHPPTQAIHSYWPFSLWFSYCAQELWGY